MIKSECSLLSCLSLPLLLVPYVIRIIFLAHLYAASFFFTSPKPSGSQGGHIYTWNKVREHPLFLIFFHMDSNNRKAIDKTRNIISPF